MKSVGVAASGHNASRKGIDYHNFAILYDIIGVQLHYAVGAHCLVYVVGNVGIFRVGEVFDAEKFLGLFYTVGGKSTASGLLVHDIVLGNIVMLLLGVKLLYDEAGHFSYKLIGSAVQIVYLCAVSRNYKRRSRLVYKYGVYFVHYGEVMASLYHILFIGDHIVPEVVEAEFVICTVGYVAGVCGALFFFSLVMDYKSGGKSQKLVDSSHLLLTHFCKVFVYRYHMDAFAFKGVKI